MNTDFPRSPSCPRSCNTANSRALAATLLLSLAALMACQSPLLIVTPIVAPAAAEGIATAATLPAPHPPFDTTPITPVETAGASVE